MTLKFSDKPQLIYGDARRLGDTSGVGDNWRSRFPAGSQPIATAPEHTSTPILVHEANGSQHWALHHNGAWQKLEPFKDWKDGRVQWRMCGESIAHPVAWSMPRKK